ncbi:hypothetical protein Esti_003841 [Eimeria stiedai]
MSGRSVALFTSWAQDLKSLVKSISYTPVPAVPSVYSAELRQLVTDMLQKEPSRRPTVQQMVALPLIQVRLVEQRQQ